MKTKPRIIFFVAEDWFFYSHFLPVARAARDQGFDVLVATRVTKHGKAILRENFRLAPLRLSRRSVNPLSEAVSLIEVVRLYAREKPDLVHHIAIKPILYGCIAARIMGISAVINSITGLGYIFLGRGRWSGAIKAAAKAAYRRAIGSTRVVVENKDDLRFLVKACVVNEAQCHLVGGVGVDLVEFAPSPEPGGVPVVMLASRMLWDKGVGEFVEAAKHLAREGLSARFVLVGDVDPANPRSIPRKQLESWHNEDAVEWWGRRDDMPATLSRANVVCLPSYREGLPKVLVEASACGRALIATDVPGCREIARANDNALLVPVRDTPALARAIAKLVISPELRTRMGAIGRRIATEEFSDQRIARQFLNFYLEMLGRGDGV